MPPPPKVQAQIDARRMQPLNLQVAVQPHEAERVLRVMGLGSNASNRRHLAPVMLAGGWPMIRTAVPGSAVRGALVVVASYGDERAAMAAGALGAVLMEHGAGMSYDDPSLPMDSPWRGGRGDGIGRKLLLSPGHELAERHLAAHPHIPVAVIGCPALDEYSGVTWPREARPRVCIGGHWDCQVLPETRSAWPWVKEALIDLAKDERWELCGTWHPHENSTGLAAEKRAFFEAHGIRVMSTWETVLEEADCFVADNTSALYEFAATGRPVVVMSPPGYRGTANHGMRFWSHIPGLQVWAASDLSSTIAAALQDGPKARALRKKAVKYVYGKLDGKASDRAANAIRARFAELVQAGKEARNFRQD
jgi:hypothetical protein